MAATLQADTIKNASSATANITLNTDGTNSLGVLGSFQRNKIINGNFQINQRGVSGTVSLAAGAYGHDRWKAGASGCTYTFSTSGTDTTLTISAGSLQQVIESVNLVGGDYVMSWAGTAQGKIGAGSYGASGVTATGVTGGANLTVEFGTGTLGIVQIESGSVATPFERRQYGQELALCQRYYGKSYDIGTVAGTVTNNGCTWTYLTNNAGTVGDLAATIHFKATMRAAPTMVWYSPDTGASGVVGTLGGDKSTVSVYVGQTSAAVYATVSNSNAQVRAHWTATAEL